MIKTIYAIAILSMLTAKPVLAQSVIFAQLQGDPIINTDGWNLTGAAVRGDTPGDADASSNELILTQATTVSSGGVFYNQKVDLGACGKWAVDFDFRIWGGTGADGIAFCFLEVPPTGFVSGGGVGIPGTNGLKVVFDTYDNGCGANPEIQIFNGFGYNECSPATEIVKLTNSGGTLGFIRSNNYNSARITYDAGNISVTVNGTPYLTANFPISFPGYVGFTSSTGAATDQHSVKNVTIYTDVAPSDAGPDLSYCTGNTPQIGTSSPNPDYTYTWTPATGLSQTNISNPVVTTVNTTNAPIIQQYVVKTSITANSGACPTYDTVLVRINPVYRGNVSQTICEGEAFPFGDTSYTFPGSYPVMFQSVSNCDSLVTLNLTVAPTYNLVRNETICEGENITLNGQVYTTSGSYPVSLQTAGGCDSLITLNLTVNPIPDAPVLTTNAPLLCPGDAYHCAVDSPDENGIYSWTGPNGFTSDKSFFSFAADKIHEGMYIVNVRVDGCTSPSTTTLLYITGGGTIADFDFPNVITANGDLINDSLDIDQFINGCGTYEVVIWNRWGNLIYRQANGEIPFHGKDQDGSKLEDGVYFYRMTYGDKEKTGTITILR